LGEYLTLGERHTALWAVPPTRLVLDADSARATDGVQEQLSTAPRQRTRRGAHFLVVVPPELEIVQRSVELEPGLQVDLRVAGKGYIVTEPSTPYRWEVPPAAPTPELPSHWYSAITGQVRSEPVADEWFLERTRNLRLTSCAGGLRRQGVTGEVLAAALLEINRLQCNPPLPEAEVRRIAASVARYRPNPTPVMVIRGGRS